MVRKPVHVDDGLRDPPSPAIGREVRAWVKEDLMPLMGEESGGSRQQPPVAVAGGSGVVDVPDWSLRAKKRHNPQNHRGGRGDGSGRDVWRVHEWASGGGRNVEETEIPEDADLDDDVLEGHDDGDFRKIEGV